MSDKKIKAVIILEMLGRPKEHLEKVMLELLETISKEKGIKVLNKNSNEAKKFENKDNKDPRLTDFNQELFTTFSEVEFEADNLMELLRICFTYMPSNVEVIEPESFNFRNNDFNLLINEIIRRLHNYDAVAKSALMQNDILKNQLSAILKNQQSLNISQNLKPENKEQKQELKKSKQEKKKKSKKK